MKFSGKFILLPLLVFFISNDINAHSSDTIYKVRKVAKKVWAIVENNTVNIYIIEGKDSALILDTGYGLGDLKSYIKKLTKLPLIVVNTHGHGDHVGNDHQFDEVYVHQRDFWIIKHAYSSEKRHNSVASKFAGKSEAELKELTNVTPPKLVPVKEGHVFDLGGRKLHVIEVPGHTQGSICLLDIKNKILFAGDNNNALVWLFLKECMPLEIYLQSLQKIEKRMNDFDVIMPGHNTPLKNTFIKEQIACVKSILDRTCNAIPYNYGTYNNRALLCKYNTAEVAFDPTNLRRE